MARSNRSTVGAENVSRYSRAARAASVKCIRCNAPVTETIDGEFVCVDCGRTVVKRKGGTDEPPAMSTGGSNDPALRANGGDAGSEQATGEDPAVEGRRGRSGSAVVESNVPTTDGGVLESIPTRPAEDPLAPAVGVVATSDSSDAVIRTIARALDRGHRVLLTYRGDPDPEVLGIARSLGVTVVEPAEKQDGRSLRAQFESTGRTMALPGVIVQTEPFARIDYARSLAALGPGEYVVDAVPETAREGPYVLTAIPACDEEDTIGEVVATATMYSDVVLVVDDGSVDGTREQAEAAGATVLRHRRNRGYGAALKTAFREAKARSADRLVILDADGQHDASDIPMLLTALDDRDADVVIGSRFVDGSETDLPRYRRFGISVINVLMNASVGSLRPSTFIKDTQSGFRVYGKDAVEALADAPGVSDDMEASVDLLYHAHTNGFRIAEVGTTVDYAVEQPNSKNPLAHGYGIVKTLLQTIERDHPLTTLGVPGLLSLSAGLGLVISLVTAPAGGQGTVPLVAMAAAGLLAFGIVASLAAVVLHGFNLNREFFEG